MQKFYAVVNLADISNPEVVSTWAGTLHADPTVAKYQAAGLNAAHKPEYQTFSVATITFDSEV